MATQGIGSALVLNIIFWLALLISIPLNGYNPLYGFAAILGVLLLSIFAGLVYLFTKGEKKAGVWVNKVANRLPFVKPDTVTTLVKKVADRIKVLSKNPQLLRRYLGRGQLAPRREFPVGLPLRLWRPRLPRRPAGRLRVGECLGGPAGHPGRPRGH